MDEAAGPIVVAGDLDDPWVSAIAAAMPPRTLRLACPQELPDDWPPLVQSARVLVLHRAILTESDAGRLGRLRAPRDRNEPRVVLCVGPYARYHHLLRWTPLADAILSEATAAEVVGRHVVPGLSRKPVASPRGSVAVVSRNYELRQMLADACIEAGYTASLACDWSEVRPGGVVVWDVPALEDAWPGTLAREAPGRRVVALFGFADRRTVALARERGASACLELPCDVADLAFVLDRWTRQPAPEPIRMADSAHAVPPAPMRFRVVRPEPEPMADPRGRD